MKLKIYYTCLGIKRRKFRIDGCTFVFPTNISSWPQQKLAYTKKNLIYDMLILLGM